MLNKYNDSNYYKHSRLFNILLMLIFEIKIEREKKTYGK